MTDTRDSTENQLDLVIQNSAAFIRNGRLRITPKLAQASRTAILACLYRKGARITSNRALARFPIAAKNCSG
jgi:hypothetical protein